MMHSITSMQSICQTKQYSERWVGQGGGRLRIRHGGWGRRQTSWNFVLSAEMWPGWRAGEGSSCSASKKLPVPMTILQSICLWGLAFHDPSIGFLFLFHPESACPLKHFVGARLGWLYRVTKVSIFDTWLRFHFNINILTLKMLPNDRNIRYWQLTNARNIWEHKTMMVDDYQLLDEFLCLFWSNRIRNIKVIFHKSSHYIIFPSQIGMIKL